VHWRGPDAGRSVSLSATVADRNGGMWVVHGDTADLAAIRREDDYLRLTTRVQMIVDDFEIASYHGGSAEDLAEVMAMFGETIQQFA
jgi:hypothetical protein